MEITPFFFENFRENFNAASMDSAPLLLKKILPKSTGAIDFSFDRN